MTQTVPPHAYPQPPANQAPQKKRRWPWIVGAAVAAIVVVPVANSGTDTPEPAGVPAGNETGKAATNEEVAKPAQNVVLYQVTGSTGAVDITYTTDGMTTMNQETGTELPWKKTIKLPADEAFQMAQLSAQGTTGSGTVKVTIKVNGKVVKSASANGYGMAMADAEIGEW